MPSIVDPATDYTGAATVTRGLVKMLTSPPLAAHVDPIAVRNTPLRWRPLAQAISLARSVVSARPAKVNYVYSHRFQRTVEESLRRNRFQLIILNGGDLLWLLDYLPASMPRIIVAHNIEHHVFDSQIRSQRRMPRPLRGFLEYDCRRLQRFELHGFQKTRNVLFLSLEDAAFAHQQCAGLNDLIIPPVFDYAPAERSRCPGEVLEMGFLANLGWWPNRDGLRWVLDNVLPRTNANVRLHLFGEHSERAVPEHPCLVKHGMVRHLEQIWNECDFAICPVVSGGGVSVKFVEAIYNRMPVLATHRAARGLSVDDDPAIVLLDRQEDWVEFLNSSAARELARRRVSAKVAITFAMENHIDALHRFVQGVVFTGQ